MRKLCWEFLIRLFSSKKLPCLSGSIVSITLQTVGVRLTGLELVWRDFFSFECGNCKVYCCEDFYKTSVTGCKLLKKVCRFDYLLLSEILPSSLIMVSFGESQLFKVMTILWTGASSSIPLISSTETKYLFSTSAISTL